MFKAKLQNVVEEYLSVPAFREKCKRDQSIGAGDFYALTYTPILSFFREHQPLSEALNLKVALIYSWNPKICEVTSARFTQAKSELAALERSTAKELNAKDIINTDMDKVIRELWYPVKKATSKRDSGSGVSVTKFLHFSFPHIFPMIDLNTMKKLEGAIVDLKSYSIFLSAWKDIYRHSKASIDQISKTVDMPVARVLDLMIFTPR